MVDRLENPRPSRWIPVLIAFWATSAWAGPPATLMPGFPVTVNNAGIASRARPLLADIDGNGGPLEILIGTKTASGGGHLVVLESTGAVRFDLTMPDEVASGVAAGQLDADPQLEFVVGFGFAQVGGVRAFDHNGSVLWTFNTVDVVAPPGGEPVVGVPTLADLDGDGRDEVIFGSWDFNIYALKGGTTSPPAVMPGWPVFVRDTSWSSAAVADLDGDGKLEIAIGADSHLEGPNINTPNGGALWVFRAGGSLFPGFPRFLAGPANDIPPGIFSSPAIGDITGDGCPEIVVGTGTPSTSAFGRQVLAFSRDGSNLPGWPVTVIGHSGTAPLLANLEGDATLEVVATSFLFDPNNFPGNSEGHIYGLRGNGTQIFQMRPRAIGGSSTCCVGDPIVGATAAANPAIIVGNTQFDVTVVSANGTQVSENGSNGGLVYTTGGTVPSAATADLDDDGDLEIVAASGVGGGNQHLGVWAWQTGVAGAAQWGQFHRNARRTGAIGTTPASCAVTPKQTRFYTLVPCRVTDSRNSAFITYGGGKLQAGEKRVITMAGLTDGVTTPADSCGVPPDAVSISLNVTALEANGSGVLKMYASGDASPNASVVLFSANQTRADNVIVPLSYDGRGNMTIEVNMSPGGQVHVLTDINGYFK